MGSLSATERVFYWLAGGMAAFLLIGWWFAGSRDSSRSSSQLSGSARPAASTAQTLPPKAYIDTPEGKAFAKKSGKRVEKIMRMHPDWSVATCLDIAAHFVKIGMSEEQVLEALGKPEHINRTIYGSHVSEQWVMSESRYLYFDDGILTAIQDSR